MSNKTLAALQDRLANLKEGSAEGEAIAFLLDINTRMLEQGITHVELAQRLGTSRSYISQLFAGNANLSMQTMSRLAAAVGCTFKVQLEVLRGKKPQL
ncbi:MAG: helix-turn-helix transcriptional regulator [Pseudomonadota bacterium]